MALRNVGTPKSADYGADAARVGLGTVPGKSGTCS